MAVNVVGCPTYAEALQVAHECRWEGYITFVREVQDGSFVVEYWKVR